MLQLFYRQTYYRTSDFRVQSPTQGVKVQIGNPLNARFKTMEAERCHVADVPIRGWHHPRSLGTPVSAWSPAMFFFLNMRLLTLYPDGPKGTKCLEHGDVLVIGSGDDNKQRKNRRENIVVERGSDDAIDTYNHPFCGFFRYQTP